MSLSLGTLSEDCVGVILLGLGLEGLMHLSRASKRLHELVHGSCGEAAWRRQFESTFGSSAGAAAADAGPQRPQRQQLQQQEAQQQKKWARILAGSATSEELTVTSTAAPSYGPCPPGQGLDSLPPPAARGTAAAHGRGWEGRPTGISTPAAVEPRQQQQRQEGGLGSRGGPSWKERFKERYVEERRLLRLRQRAKVMKLESSVQLLEQEVHRLRRALREEETRLEAARGELAAVRRERQAAAVKAISDQYWLPAAVQRSQGMVTTQTPVDLEGREQEVQQRLAVCQLELRKLRNQVRQREARLEEERRKLRALQP